MNYSVNPLSRLNLLNHTYKISKIFPELTETELVMVLLLSSGLKPLRMGELLVVSKSTINAHIENIRVKFQVDNYEEVKQVCELRIILYKESDKYKPLFEEIDNDSFGILVMICSGYSIEDISSRLDKESCDIQSRISELKEIYHVEYLSDLRAFFSIRLKLHNAVN